MEKQIDWFEGLDLPKDFFDNIERDTEELKVLPRPPDRPRDNFPDPNEIETSLGQGIEVVDCGEIRAWERLKDLINDSPAMFITALGWS